MQGRSETLFEAKPKKHALATSSPHPRVRIFFGVCALLVLLCGMTGTSMASAFPDTSTCAGVVEIDFPTTTTITKDYLFVGKCINTGDFNSGDFVSVWVEDAGGSPIQSISEFENTEAGVEWTSPLSDSNGLVWGRVNLTQEVYDCNSTGVPYTLEISWDTKTKNQLFYVRCPQLTMERYRTEVPYGQGLSVSVKVQDDMNYNMRGVTCSSLLLYDASDENGGTIKQRKIEVQTNNMGLAEFDFEPGILQGFLIEYDYVTKIECLGADVNFDFAVTESDAQFLRNPLYYSILFLSDNAIPLLLTIVFIGIIVAMAYMIFKKKTE